MERNAELGFSEAAMLYLPPFRLTDRRKPSKTQIVQLNLRKRNIF